MILKLNNKSSYDEDLEFLGNYIKGKNPKSFMDYRPLFRGVKTGKVFLLMLSEHPVSSIDFHFEEEFKVIIPNQKLRHKMYNYYYIDNDYSKIDKIFTEWKNGNPLIHVGNFIHRQMNDIRNYTWTYEFNGKKY